MDVAIFRQNTEGSTAASSGPTRRTNVREALGTHPKMEKFLDVPSEDLAVSTRIFTRGACRRICEAAFEYADKFGYTSVTVCEKPNVIRETSGMMEAEAKKVSENYPGIDLWSTNIDAQMMWLTKNPEDYGVIVAGNMFGDIVSDGFAGLVGRPRIRVQRQHRRRLRRLRADARFGAEVRGTRPVDRQSDRHDPLGVHDARPHRRGGEGDEHPRGDRARSSRTGKVQSYDMMKLRGGPDAIKQGAATTTADDRRDHREL